MQMKNDPCRKDYEMIGTKKKNGKEVPNCVPKEEACCDDCADLIEEEAEHEGRKVTLNKPFGGDSKHKRYVYVKNDKGNVIKLGFGDPNMEIKRDDPERRKAYRARHNCDNPGPKWKANYWSCKYWSSTPTSKLDENDLVGFKSFLEGVERDKVDLNISKEVERDKERHDRMRDQADRVDAASTKAQNRRLANEGIASTYARVTLSTKDKARVMQIVSGLSDTPGYWDHKKMNFSAKGELELAKALKNNKSEIAYAKSLDYSDFEESTSNAVSIPMYVQEAAYDGNIGMMELAKFYMKASPADKQKLQDAIKNKRFKEAWKMVEKVTGVKLVGKEFNESTVIYVPSRFKHAEDHITNVIHKAHGSPAMHDVEVSFNNSGKREVHVNGKKHPELTKHLNKTLDSVREDTAVAANSVAGGGVDMNPTGKPKWDKRSKFHIDHMFRRADGTKYKKNKNTE